MLLYQGKVQEAEQEVRQALARYPDQFKCCLRLHSRGHHEGGTDRTLTNHLSANVTFRFATNGDYKALGSGSTVWN
jgi:hypothetical protein